MGGTIYSVCVPAFNKFDYSYLCAVPYALKKDVVKHWNIFTIIQFL